MLSDSDTPSTVMYTCMKQFGGIKNYELARIVFSDSFSYGGTPIVDRISNRSFLSRMVIRSMPGDFPERAFKPFAVSAQTVYSRLTAKHSGAQGKAEIADYFSGEACEKMRLSLADAGLNELIYRNLAKRLKKMETISISDKAMLLVMLFISTGALGDPARASALVQERMRQIAESDAIRTEVVTSEFIPTEQTIVEHTRMGLCRIEDGKMRMPAYTLSLEDEGTEIGLLTTSEHSINDVGSGVSRRHLRIFMNDEGRWFAQGLGSTNGTTVIRGDTGEEEPVELPRRKRMALGTDQQDSPCVELFANDILCLAKHTQFVVLELA